MGCSLKFVRSGASKIRYFVSSQDLRIVLEKSPNIVLVYINLFKFLVGFNILVGNLLKYSLFFIKN